MKIEFFASTDDECGIGQILHTCKDVKDLCLIQKMIFDYLQKYIDEETNSDA